MLEKIREIMFITVMATMVLLIVSMLVETWVK